ncbi:hypothetical protein [Sphingomonas hankookensis]|nr:hypothetical protein [Sphingomonas hankookensis]
MPKDDTSRMTPTNDAPVTVEQCDRDEAAAIHRHFCAYIEATDVANGRAEGDYVLGIVARHRLAAIASAPVFPSLELCVQFSDDGQHIRKWSRLPFDGGTCLYSHPASAPAGDGVSLREALSQARQYVERKSCDAFDDREDKLLAAIDAALDRPRAAVGIDAGMQQAVAEVLNAAWGLCDDTAEGSSDIPRVPREAWMRQSAALDALEALIPVSEHPCLPGVAARLIAAGPEEASDPAVSGLQPVHGHAEGRGAHDGYNCDCPRAALGEREAIARLIYSWHPHIHSGRTDAALEAGDPHGTHSLADWHELSAEVQDHFLKRADAILALQSPPAKVEG